MQVSGLAVLILVTALALAGCLGEDSEDETVYTAIKEITPESPKVGQTVWLNGTEPEGRPGTIECGWLSSIDGSIGAGVATSTDKLSPGEHVISFECHDSQGTWTESAVAPLTIHEDALAIVLSSSKASSGDYSLNVVNAIPKKSLDDYQYWLKDGSGSVVQSGEIALQNLSGKWHGVDTTWDGKTADHYDDDMQAQTRIDDVNEGNQSAKAYQKGEGTISVSFYDSDGDGQLTAGDIFTVRNGGEHPAEDGYSLGLNYKDKDIGSIILG